ncbi:UDP-N-acetylbacillosamine N-acetyltransferase [Vibrio cholerae]|nr:UDP-N-acetylbacillosamine N-acetyltransferase [Vibrio cholerae]BCN20696.1 putative acyltransferase [Vibrio cholerae]
MKNKKLVIIGAGELARIAFEYFTYDSSYDVFAFSVNKEFIESSEINGIPVVEFEELERIYPPSEYEAFVAIPATKLNRVRTRLFNEAKNKGYKLATYISSSAFVWRNAEIGENCFIFENNTIQPFVKIEDNVILWSGNHIGHRTVIRANSFITSHAVISGYCEIGSGSFVGVNAIFNDKTSLAANSIVGSGAVVTKKLKTEEGVYIGNPAKLFPRKSAFDIEL